MNRKYVILCGDGMADDPVSELKGKTPLQAANTPHLDRLAGQGTLGMVRTVPSGFPPGSDVANLSIFGYDPALHYTGRAPLEAASMGVWLRPGDVAFRCNLVTLGVRDGREYMEDFSAGHISTEDAGRVISLIGEKLGSTDFRFYPGVSYRHLMVWSKGERGLTLKTTPPHDISGKDVASYLPQGEGAEEILDLMKRAKGLLPLSPVNLSRQRDGKRAANAIWLWGQGKAPLLIPMTQRFGLTGSVISAVDLMKGIGFYAGLEIIQVPGATGYLDTNYGGKAEYALREISRKDLVYVHVEAPDEASHNGNLKDKLRAIEDFDHKIVSPILRGLEDYPDFRILVLPDHPTPLALKTHSSEPVPFLAFSTADRQKVSRQGRTFDEASASQTGLCLARGHELMEKFLEGF